MESGEPPYSAHRGTIEVGASADGTLTYLVHLPPEAFPPVRARDVEAAWEQARSAAMRQLWGPARLFRFRREDGTATDMVLADPDACCWARAVDSTVGMASIYGLALCLRLLALVNLLAGARWASPLFTLRRDGAEIDPVLLRAAARAPLTRDALFDPDFMRSLVAGRHLPPPPSAPRISPGVSA
jgi:hypothetical protein